MCKHAVNNVKQPQGNIWLSQEVEGVDKQKHGEVMETYNSDDTNINNSINIVVRVKQQ